MYWNKILFPSSLEGDYLITLLFSSLLQNFPYAFWSPIFPLIQLHTHVHTHIPLWEEFSWSSLIDRWRPLRSHLYYAINRHSTKKLQIQKTGFKWGYFSVWKFIVKLSERGYLSWVPEWIEMYRLQKIREIWDSAVNSVTSQSSIIAIGELLEY